MILQKKFLIEIFQTFGNSGVDSGVDSLVAKTNYRNTVIF